MRWPLHSIHAHQVPLKGAGNRVPAMLSERADLTLVFDDGTTLPANRDLLCIHSPVLTGLLAGGGGAHGELPAAVSPVSSRSSAWEAVAGGGAAAAANEPAAGNMMRIPLPDEERGTWLAALRILYCVDPPRQEVGWANVLPLLRLAHKFDVRALRWLAVKFMDEADWRSCPKEVAAACPGGTPVWDWIEAAAQCGVERIVTKCCERVLSQRLALPETVCLGAAAMPLARYLAGRLHRGHY